MPLNMQECHGNYAPYGDGRYFGAKDTAPAALTDSVMMKRLRYFVVKSAIRR